MPLAGEPGATVVPISSSMLMLVGNAVLTWVAQMYLGC